MTVPDVEAARDPFVNWVCDECGETFEVVSGASAHYKRTGHHASEANPAADTVEDLAVLAVDVLGLDGVEAVGAWHTCRKELLNSRSEDRIEETAAELREVWCPERDEWLCVWWVENFVRVYEVPETEDMERWTGPDSDSAERFAGAAELIEKRG